MAANGTRTIQVKFDGSTTGLTAASKQAEKDISSVGSKAEKSGGLVGGAIAIGLTAAGPLVAASLIGGVALGFVGVTALVQKNNRQVQASFGDLKDQVVGEMTDVTDQVVPYLTKAAGALQQTFANLGPQLSYAFSFAGPDINTLTSGVENLADNAMPGLVTSMRNSQPIVKGIAVILGDLGDTATTVLDGLSAHSDQFGKDLGELGTTIEDLGSVAAGVLPGLASGFGVGIGSVNRMLTVLKPIAPELGNIAGQAAPIVGIFKLVGAATAPIGNLGDKIKDTGNSMVGLNGESSALGRTVSGVGKSIGAVANALPLAGAAFGVVSTVIADSDEKFVTWQADIVAGGAAATQALQQFQGQVSFMPGSFQKLLAGLTPLQHAQADYNIAVVAFGVNSKQAVTAQHNLAAANAVDEASQQRLNLAMMSTNEQLAQQQSLLLASIDANLSFQSTVFGVKQAQTDYTKAVHDFGGKSDSARQSLISFEQAQQNEVAQAVKAATAANASGTAQQKAAAQSDAYTSAVLGLVAASGGHLTPALKEMASHLSAASISAFEATGKLAGTKQAVITLPNGKKITIDVNSNGQAVATNTQRALNSLHAPDLRIVAQDGVTSKVNEIIRFNSGKTIHVNVQTGQISALGLPHRALGGPAPAGQALIVGDGGGPEIFVPHQNGSIIGTRETADLLGGDTFDLVIADQVIASIVDGRLRAHDRTLVARVKAGSRIR